MSVCQPEPLKVEGCERIVPRPGLGARSFHFRPYPVMLYCGLVCGILVATRWAATHGLASGRTNAALLILALPALAGARLLFVLTHWDVFRREPARVWRSSQGGAALYGGLILSLAFSLPLLRVLEIPAGGFWDAASIAMLTGMIFARAGCLFAGCCAGRPTEGWLGLWLPDRAGIRRRRVPVQILEAALAGLTLASTPWIGEWLPFRGSVFLFSVMAYGTGRWVLEPARETVDSVGGVGVNRAISGTLAGLAAAGLLLGWLGAH